MTVPVFDESLRTGNAALDDQHAALFRLAARVEDKIGSCPLEAPEGSSYDEEACEENVSDALTDAVYGLVDYATEHFSDEEALMRTSGFPGAGSHISLHAELSERVGGHLMRLVNGDEVAAEELLDFFVSWLTSHINRHDREFTEWLSDGHADCLEKGSPS